MASSSVSQEDVENDFELSSRRSRIRSARARTTNCTRLEAPQDNEETCELKTTAEIAAGSAQGEHDASPKPVGRGKDKRVPRNVPIRQPLADHINRANHLNKGKQQRDRRKLREKRRSTGVVHIQSTESTGGSTGEEEEQLASSVETKTNTFQNEQLGELPDRQTHSKPFQRRNKSPSDLDADDEDNQNQSDSTVSSFAHLRPGTPIAESESVEERLERAQSENHRLLSLLEEKDRKIISLENRMHQVMAENSAERARLQKEVISLSTKLATKSK